MNNIVPNADSIHLGSNGIMAITPHNFPQLIEWYSYAVSSPSVLRFMQSDAHVSLPVLADIERGDWRDLYLMDGSRNAVMHVHIDREGYQPELGIALWTLHAETMPGKLAAGRLIKFAMERLQIKYNARKIRTAVHATNAPSLALMNDLFGPPWGIDPLAAVDCYLGEYVDMHKFCKIYN